LLPLADNRSRAASKTSRSSFTPLVTAQQSGQSGFAGAGRAVEDHRAEPIRREEAAKQFSFAEEMLLAGELVERLWPHPRRQRLRPAAIGSFTGFEEAHGGYSTVGEGSRFVL
jgi:hypothetical protein